MTKQDTISKSSIPNLISYNTVSHIFSGCKLFYEEVVVVVDVLLPPPLNSVSFQLNHTGLCCHEQQPAGHDEQHDEQHADICHHHHHHDRQ
jgi:hypothetical protein